MPDDDIEAEAPFTTVYHDETKNRAVVPTAALEHYAERGWEPVAADEVEVGEKFTRLTRLNRNQLAEFGRTQYALDLDAEAPKGELVAAIQTAAAAAGSQG
jgi:hypothetical protein